VAFRTATSTAASSALLMVSVGPLPPGLIVTVSLLPASVVGVKMPAPIICCLLIASCMALPSVFVINFQFCTLGMCGLLYWLTFVL